MNGLEIYEINGNGNLTKISVLNIARPETMFIKDQYLYISSGNYYNTYIIPEYNIKISKIDISDVYNPVILDQIEYPEINQFGAIFKLGNYMVMKWSGVDGFYHDFYNLPEMEYVGQIISENHHKVVNDSLLVRQDGYTLYIEQYNPPDEFEVIGIIDVSAYSDGNYTYDHFKVKNDTILSAVNLKSIAFWDISDATNWQYLSRYTLPENSPLSGNKQYVIMGENAVIFDAIFLRLLDISDIVNPILVDSIAHNMAIWGRACDYYGNNLYVGTVNDGIQHYWIENNAVEYEDSYYDHIRFLIGDMYYNKIITSTIYKGYYLFDVDNPLNPVDLGEWFDEKYYSSIHKLGGWMVLRDYEEYALEIYDITNLENPILRNTLPLDNYGYYWNYCFIDESDPVSIYLCNYQTNMFWKFDISDPGEAIERFEYELPPDSERLVIFNSVAYVTFGSSPYNLLVIVGLEDSEPYIANEINNFSENKYLDNQNGYIVSYGSTLDIGQVFQLDNPLQPELYFTPQWGERIEIKDDLIFAKLNHIVGVYENRSNSTEPIAIFNGLNHIYNINLIEHEGINYLITNEMANIGLFEYTYIPSSAEDELPKPEITLSNYPNPFNPETNIVFNLKEEGEVQLDIYNIKGQKIKQLVSDSANQLSAGQHSVVWDGTDENNKQVSSGIYMYQLKVDGKTVSSKKCLLLK